MGVPIIRIVVFWGLYWGPPILGNDQIVSGCLELYKLFEGFKVSVRLQSLVLRLEFAFGGSGLRKRIRSHGGIRCLVVQQDFVAGSADLLLMMGKAWLLKTLNFGSWGDRES